MARPQFPISRPVTRNIVDQTVDAQGNYDPAALRAMVWGGDYDLNARRDAITRALIQQVMRQATAQQLLTAANGPVIDYKDTGGRGVGPTDAAAKGFNPAQGTIPLDQQLGYPSIPEDAKPEPISPTPVTPTPTDKTQTAPTPTDKTVTTTPVTPNEAPNTPIPGSLPTVPAFTPTPAFVPEPDPIDMSVAQGKPGQSFTSQQTTQSMKGDKTPGNVIDTGKGPPSPSATGLPAAPPGGLPAAPPGSAYSSQPGTWMGKANDYLADFFGWGGGKTPATPSEPGIITPGASISSPSQSAFGGPNAFGGGAAVGAPGTFTGPGIPGPGQAPVGGNTFAGYTSPDAAKGGYVGGPLSDKQANADKAAMAAVVAAGIPGQFGLPGWSMPGALPDWGDVDAQTGKSGKTTSTTTDDEGATPTPASFAPSFDVDVDLADVDLGDITDAAAANAAVDAALGGTVGIDLGDLGGGGGIGITDAGGGGQTSGDTVGVDLGDLGGGGNTGVTDVGSVSGGGLGPGVGMSEGAAQAAADAAAAAAAADAALGGDFAGADVGGVGASPY